MLPRVCRMSYTHFPRLSGLLRSNLCTHLRLRVQHRTVVRWSVQSCSQGLSLKWVRVHQPHRRPQHALLLRPGLQHLRLPLLLPPLAVRLHLHHLLLLAHHFLHALPTPFGRRRLSLHSFPPDLLRHPVLPHGCNIMLINHMVRGVLLFSRTRGYGLMVT